MTNHEIKYLHVPIEQLLSGHVDSVSDGHVDLQVERWAHSWGFNWKTCRRIGQIIGTVGKGF